MKRTLLISIFLCLIPISASAQLHSTPETNTGLFVSATTTSTGVGAGLIVLTIAETQREPKKITAFLKHNSTRFRSDLALGTGQSIADFASLMGIAENEIASFEKRLRSNRKFVVSFCDPKQITTKRTLELIAWVDRYYPAVDAG